MFLIKLTELDDRPVWVNSDMILKTQKHQEIDATEVYVNKLNRFLVKETPEEIAQAIHDW